MIDIDDETVVLRLPEEEHEESIIKVIGVGGGGSNAVNHMFRLGIHGVEFVICNTDIQALRLSQVKNRVQLGKELTEGRGAGCRPERGRMAAVESMGYIEDLLSHNTRMVFITAGMGGGTGTGAAPEIAKKSRELGILTVGIVTLPFQFEGKQKVQQAMEGIDDLEQYVDALLIIDNERLREMYGNLKLSDAFAAADNVLAIAAKSIAEIITVKGFVNVDFADVESVLRDSGVAIMGAAEVEGENRAAQALESALISPLLSSNDIRGASNILLNVLYGDKEVTMDEISLITDTLQQKIGQNVNVIWGAGKDESLGDKLRVAIIASGFNKSNATAFAPSQKVKEETEDKPVERKAYFKVDRLPEDLVMQVDNTEELEEEARQRRKRQEEDRRRKVSREEAREYTARERETKGVNEMPNSEGWLHRKVVRIGSLFSDED